MKVNKLASFAVGIASIAATACSKNEVPIAPIVEEPKKEQTRDTVYYNSMAYVFDAAADTLKTIQFVDAQGKTIDIAPNTGGKYTLEKLNGNLVNSADRFQANETRAQSIKPNDGSKKAEFQANSEDAIYVLVPTGTTNRITFENAHVNTVDQANGLVTQNTGNAKKFSLKR